jgi:glycosyltransferase involved in cell wall biosynthesis
MIAIITVNWNGYDWLDLLLHSVKVFASQPVEIVVVDNNVEKQPVDDVHLLPQACNVGHGQGLNIGCEYVRDNLHHVTHVMFLDVDCHFIRRGWEDAFMGTMDLYDVVGGRGVPQKPIRPACMFMDKLFSDYDWSSTPGYKGHRVTPDGFDVAIRAYKEMLADQVRVGLLESVPSHYHTMNGEEWCVEETPYVYHHWHGTHLTERGVDFPGKDLFADKTRLFSLIPWEQI